MADLNIKPNALFTRDNLYVMNGMNSESIDLIYLDPPFNSKRLYKAPVGSRAAGAAFEDMWKLDDVDRAYLLQLAEKFPHLYKYIESIKMSHSESMMAYIAYMAQRLFEMHRVLKDTGSIYLHCDPTAGHYLKVVMDFIFGGKNFRNEIIWFYHDTPGRPKRDFARKHDMILRYAKSDEWAFNADSVRIPILPASKERYKTARTLGGKQYVGGTSASKGKIPESVWQMPAIKRNARESTGYPTQKPLKLLDRIIRASSNEDDVVLDPFCGCATTCVAAQHLHRRWIGIDLSTTSADLIRDRLKDGVGALFNDFTHYTELPDRRDVQRMKPKAAKPILYGKQSGNCGGCKRHFEACDLEVDHRIPKSEGGGDFLENYQLLCGHCNRIKNNRPMEYLLAILKNREAQRSFFGPIPPD